MMRETTKSLRIYFIVIGVFNLFPVGSVLKIQSDLFLGISSSISIVFGFFYLYFGARLGVLIFKSSKLITNVLVTEIFYSIALFLYQLSSSGFQPVILIVLGIVLVVNLYLISNVNKLAKEKNTPLIE